ncbi:6-carboxytetrahydropterin synthase [Halomonas sp.]|uniref:6-pyruvoyl trahydropterin synthase family protein n=1 Tax=Halomonas sp. TaxID=1486246 RepID=UPI002631EF4E|nr:6-carboxytetrahydropterin synthase [Halomonas sp.]
MTLFVNRLTQLDVSWWCSTRGLVGASWHVDVELDGELGEDGMLFDFGEVKPWIKQRLDADVDHTLLVPTRAPGLEFHDCREGLCLRASVPWSMELRAPHQALTLLPWREIRAERLADHLAAELMRRPPPRVSDIRLRLREEEIDGAAYTYSHGLRRHAGNCQRIAHGHRSRLYIWQLGKRAPLLERRWADWLADRYLVDQADIVADDEPGWNQLLTTRYATNQGEFALSLPKERCHVLQTPTTVEWIADWLARQIARETGHDTRVQAFEGIDKGAIAQATP